MRRELRKANRIAKKAAREIRRLNRRYGIDPSDSPYQQPKKVPSGKPRRSDWQPPVAGIKENKHVVQQGQT